MLHLFICMDVASPHLYYPHCIDFDYPGRFIESLRWYAELRIICNFPGSGKRL
jgi:hypothetical protein